MRNQNNYQLFLRSVKKINDKYNKSLKNYKYLNDKLKSFEMSESHSSEKYYINKNNNNPQK